MKSIPIIDIAALRDAPLSTPRASPHQAIGRASEAYGFFQVVNHGLPDSLVEDVWNQTRSFFELPRAAKLAVSRTKENPRGYFDRELTKNKRDLKEVFDFAQARDRRLAEEHPDNRAAVDGSNQWPAPLPLFKPTMLGYFQACEELGLVLLAALCEGLGVGPKALHRYFIPVHTSFVRLNYYPLADPVEENQRAQTTQLGEMALHHHTDAGALTILLQDEVGGLQILADDVWLDVPPIEGALVINVADMMQIWSNGRYRAALHRVRPVTGTPRYSIPFFFNPAYETDCAPIPAVAGDRPRYRTVNWGEFRRARTDGDYADYGKEIQIDDFVIHGRWDDGAA